MSEWMIGTIAMAEAIQAVACVGILYYWSWNKRLYKKSSETQKEQHEEIMAFHRRQEERNKEAHEFDMVHRKAMIDRVIADIKEKA